MFGVTGAGLAKVRHMQNGGKPARRSLDQWDRVGLLQQMLFVLDVTQVRPS